MFLQPKTSIHKKIVIIVWLILTQIQMVIYTVCFVVVLNWNNIIMNVSITFTDLLHSISYVSNKANKNNKK